MFTKYAELDLFKLFMNIIQLILVSFSQLSLCKLTNEPIAGKHFAAQIGL